MFVPIIVLVVKSHMQNAGDIFFFNIKDYKCDMRVYIRFNTMFHKKIWKILPDLCINLKILKTFT